MAHVSVAARRHVHRGASCLVCCPDPASTIKQQSINQHDSWQPAHSQAQHSPSPISTSCTTINDHVPSERLWKFPAWVQDPEGRVVSNASRKEHAMKQLLEIQQSKAGQTGSSNVRHVYPSHLDKVWRRFRCDEPLTTAESDSVIDFLASVGEAHSGGCSSAPPSPAASASSANSTTSIPQAPDKQHLFGKTLPIFLRVLPTWDTRGTGNPVSFFLCCGSALGAWRENRFIEHDTDIDVGIFFEDLEEVGASQMAAKGEGTGDEGVTAASHAVGSLIADLADQMFMCIDVLGQVDKGLELRFQHLDTRVLLDVNVYYQPLPEDDNDHIKDDKSFVWCATHYGDSSKRRHGMYRYRHSPFRHLLVAKENFAERNNSDGGHGFRVLLPPVSYLEEYFGADWKVPVKYDYAQGLEKHYKNIIPE